MALRVLPVNHPSSDECSICLERLDNGEPVERHEGQAGETHPFHKECLKSAVISIPSCPNCREPIDTSSLFSTMEKIKNFFKVRKELFCSRNGSSYELYYKGY